VNLEPPDSDDQIAAARALRWREAKDPREVEKYLRHCERVVIEHMRANGWPVDDYIIRFEVAPRVP